MHPDIKAFNEAQDKADRDICEVLSAIIDRNLPEAQSKIWHRHPVWFLDGNPTVGYSRLKAGIRLMFWSGADFEEKELKPGTGKFKDASINLHLRSRGERKRPETLVEEVQENSVGLQKHLQKEGQTGETEIGLNSRSERPTRCSCR